MPYNKSKIPVRPCLKCGKDYRPTKPENRWHAKCPKKDEPRDAMGFIPIEFKDNFFEPCVVNPVYKTITLEDPSFASEIPYLMSPIPEEPSDTDTSELKAALNDALRRLDKLKRSKEGLVDAIYQAARDGISAIDYAPIPEPTFPNFMSGPGNPEVAIAILSDFQLAKKTPNYDSDVCEDRVRLYGDKVIRMANIQRADHPVDELRMWILGDVVEGELIFPGQAHLIDASLYRQVTVDGPRILGDFIKKMLANFKIVKVTAVIGNHGALGGPARREMNGESNADRMLYRILQLIFMNEPRVTFNIPDGDGERSWYAVDHIGEHGYLLCHGDQFRFGIKSPSAEQKILGWRTGAIPEPFQEVVCGHWHQPNRLSLKGGTTTLRCNGSTESYNTYAQEFVGSMNRPSQWLLFANEHRGTTAEYLVWLD